MTADDTSREALVERVAREIDPTAFSTPYDEAHDPRDWEHGRRRRVDALRAAGRVVDAVVMPLVEERDAT